MFKWGGDKAIGTSKVCEGNLRLKGGDKKKAHFSIMGKYIIKFWVKSRGEESF